MKKNFTDKMEKFCQAVADGKNHSDAYRIAYNADRMKPTTINRRATDLMKNSTITARIDELRQQLADKSGYTREQGLNKLKKIVERAESVMVNGFSPAAAKTIINAIAEMNKMCGFYAPENVNNAITISFGDADEWAR